MEDTPHEDDPNTTTLVKDDFFNKSEYISHLDSTNKKHTST